LTEGELVEGIATRLRNVVKALSAAKSLGASLVFAVALTCHALAGAQPSTVFVFVRVMDPVLPLERGSKYEDPLDEALKRANLGEVTGGGTSLSKEKTIEWVGLDVELTDVMRGIPFLKRKLIELGAPQGSSLEYEFGGRKLQVPVHD
jgi:hypothetical protein